MATPIRVTLKYVEILDSKDFDKEGEFVFEFKVSAPGRGVEQSTRIPEKGHWSLSDHPAMNRVTVDRVIFEGEVEDGDTLVVDGKATELDRISADDVLTEYHRELTGPVADWLGLYSPWDEGTEHETDPEQLGDWRISFVIEEA